jgi:hypothetical protein
MVCGTGAAGRLDGDLSAAGASRNSAETKNSVAIGELQTSNKSSSRCVDIHDRRESDGWGLTTLPMIFVSSRQRVTGRPSAPFRDVGKDRDRRQRAVNDAVQQESC